jgi:hypothetical protein
MQLLSWPRAAVLALPVLVFTAGSPRALNEAGAPVHPVDRQLPAGHGLQAGQCKFAACFERCLSLVGAGDFTNNRKCSTRCSNHGCV